MQGHTCTMTQMFCSAQPAQRRWEGGKCVSFHNKSQQQPISKTWIKQPINKKAERKSKRQLLYSATPVWRSPGPDQSTHTAAATPPWGSWAFVHIGQSHPPPLHQCVARGYCCSLNMTHFSLSFFFLERKSEGVKYAYTPGFLLSTEWGWLIHKAIFRSRKQEWSLCRALRGTIFLVVWKRGR